MLSYIWKPFLRMKIHCFHQRTFCSSSLLPPLQLPSRRETHLWYILPNEVKSESLLRKYVDLLPPHEKDHIFSMRGNELQKHALLSRALVRTTIPRYIPQVSAESLEFRKNAHGKPEVIWQQTDDWDPPPLHFNLSHTPSLIACGVTMDSPIGIDVEEKQRTMKTNILSFARRYCTREEVEVLSAISDPEILRQEFVKLWTLKESYVKALGKGISGAPFKTFTISVKSANPNPKDSVVVIKPVQNEDHLTTNWEIALVELDGSHYAAICRHNEGKMGGPMKLSVWKTVPLVEEEYVSNTRSVVPIVGLNS